MIYAEGPGLRPNSMGIWQNEAGYLLDEDADECHVDDQFPSGFKQDERVRHSHKR